MEVECCLQFQKKKTQKFKQLVFVDRLGREGISDFRLSEGHAMNKPWLHGDRFEHEVPTQFFHKTKIEH